MLYKSYWYTLTSLLNSGTLQKNETITGATSGATATILAEDYQ